MCEYNGAMTYTRIGCEAWIVRDGKVLLLKRKGGQYAGTWSLPGGHLEFLEQVDEAVVREVAEETGIQVTLQDVRPIAITDDLRPEVNQHYLHITFEVTIGDQEPRVMEPDKCSDLQWFDINDLPGNIFPFQAKVFTRVLAKELYISSKPSMGKLGD